MAVFSLPFDARTLALDPQTYFPDGPGRYRLRVRAEFSDTSPSFSESAWVEIELRAVPSTTLMAAAIATPTDPTLWSDVLNNPVATTRQREIAQIAFNLASAIASPGTQFGSFNVPVSFIGQATNDLNAWVNSAPTLTFNEWFVGIRSDTSEASATTIKNAITAHATSSVSALLNSLNALTFPAESDPRFVMGANWDFVNQSAQSRGGSISDDSVLRTYRAYQAEIATSSVRPLPIFQDFVLQGGWA